MLEPRLLAATVVVALALPVAGVDRIVTDGGMPTAASQPAPDDHVAFKSDYFPLER